MNRPRVGLIFGGRSVEHEVSVTSATSILGELDIQLQSISTGAAIFGRSPDEQHAAAALTGFVRPWNAFRNGVQALRLCCPVPLPLDAAAESESDSGGQGKKKGA